MLETTKNKAINVVCASNKQEAEAILLFAKLMSNSSFDIFKFIHMTIKFLSRLLFGKPRKTRMFMIFVQYHSHKFNEWDIKLWEKGAKYIKIIMA